MFNLLGRGGKKWLKKIQIFSVINLGILAHFYVYGSFETKDSIMVAFADKNNNNGVFK